MTTDDNCPTCGAKTVKKVSKTKLPDNTELAKILVKKFDEEFKEICDDFLNVLDEHKVDLSKLFNTTEIVDSQIGDIIHIINYYKLNIDQLPFGAKLQRIEFKEDYKVFTNWEPNNYFKLIFYPNNPVHTTQSITWGKHKIEINLPPEDLHKYKLQVGGTYQIKNIGMNRWKLVDPPTQ